MARGEFVCVIGHSGCGKTTVLNILAGLDTPSTGTGESSTARRSKGPSLDRAVIFQSTLCCRGATVLGNVAYRYRRVIAAGARRGSRSTPRTFIDLVGLTGAEHKRPAELSGGNEAAVGIAPRAVDRTKDHVDGRAVLGARPRSPAAPCRTRCAASAPRPGRPCS